MLICSTACPSEELLNTLPNMQLSVSQDQRHEKGVHQHSVKPQR